MARKRLPQQQELLSDLLVITQVREGVERLLEHVVRLQSETIGLASAYGVSHTSLGELAQLSRQRVGQIADQVDPTPLSVRALHGQVHQVYEWPGDVMGALTGEKYPPDRDDPERAAVLHRQITIVYGRDEADRRAAARTRLLASTATDPDRRADLVERARRRRQTIHGPETDH